MKKIFTYVAGNTLDSHKDFMKKLTERGAKVVDTLETSDLTIVFCPIVSRFETDITSALMSAAEFGCQDVILVVMHHTFNKNYVLPSQRQQTNPRVILMVDCLFFEKRGLFTCSCNTKAVDVVRKELGLPDRFNFSLKEKGINWQGFRRDKKK